MRPLFPFFPKNKCVPFFHVLTAEMARLVAMGVGLSEEEYRQVQMNTQVFVEGIPRIGD